MSKKTHKIELTDDELDLLRTLNSHINRKRKIILPKGDLVYVTEECLPTPKAEKVAGGLAHKLQNASTREPNEVDYWYSAIEPEEVIGRYTMVSITGYKNEERYAFSVNGIIDHLEQKGDEYWLRVAGVDVPEPLTRRQLDDIHYGHNVAIRNK